MFKATQNKIIFVLAMAASLFAIIWWINMPAYTNLENVIPDAKMSTQEFLSEVYINESSVSEEFIEKTIEINGVIDEITFKNNTYTLLLSGGENSKHILCEMRKGQETVLNSYKKNDSITIKGVYKGSLLDAIFLHCIIIETRINE